MTFEAILILAAKVLGCAVAIYFLAGFIVSRVRLLPILAILSSIGTIIAVACIRGVPNGEHLLWIPIVTSLLTQLFYQGEGYMNPRVHENLYELVSVERKYTSLFAEFDDYELHYSPVETGGFVENTIFGGLIYGFYFSALTFTYPDSWTVYIMPIYLLCMSIIDLLIVIGVLDIPAIFYNLARVGVIILAVSIGFLGGSNEKSGGASARTDEMYEACLELVEFDYTKSYSFLYEDATMQSYEYVPQFEKQFIYDAEYDIGAEYTGVGSSKRYTHFYVALDEFNGKVGQLYNSTWAELDDLALMFVRYADYVGGAFKYSTVDSLDYAARCGFTKQQFEHATEVQVSKNDQYVYVLYQSRHDSSYTSKNHYQVSYSFYTDKSGNPTALKRIECNIFTSDTTRQRFVYTPIYEETELSTLFDFYGEFTGYTHNPDVIYGIDFSEVFEKLDKDSWAGEYDFTLTEHGDQGYTAYMYDAQTDTVAEYTPDNYEVGLEASNNNDFLTYLPDYFISNADELKYYPDGEIAVDRGSRFRKFTCDNYDAFLAFGYTFSVYFAPESINAEETLDGDVMLTVTIRHPQYEEETETYRFFLRKRPDGSYFIYIVYFNGVYAGKEYSVDIYYYDKYNISMPASVGEE